MRLFFVFIILLIFQSYSNGQGFAKQIPFEKFKKWAAQTKVENLKFHKAEKNGKLEDTTYSYSAIFKDSSYTLIVTFSRQSDFYSYKLFTDTNVAKPYIRDSLETVYYTIIGSIGMFSTLCISLPKIDACISFLWSQLIPANKLEKIVDNFDLYAFNIKVEDIADKKTEKPDKPTIPLKGNTNNPSVNWWWGF